MSKSDEMYTLIDELDITDDLAARLIVAFEAAIEEAESTGYDDCLEDDQRQDVDKEALIERLNYLEKGGRWLCESGVERDADAYIDGFVDALRTAGVK